MRVYERDACAGLYERYAPVLRVDELLRKDLMLRQGLMEFDRLVKIDVRARGPLLEDLFADGVEFVVGDALILKIIH